MLTIVYVFVFFRARDGSLMVNMRSSRGFCSRYAWRPGWNSSLVSNFSCCRTLFSSRCNIYLAFRSKTSNEVSWSSAHQCLNDFRIESCIPSTHIALIASSSWTDPHVRILDHTEGISSRHSFLRLKERNYLSKLKIFLSNGYHFKKNWITSKKIRRVPSCPVLTLLGSATQNSTVALVSTGSYFLMTTLGYLHQFYKRRRLI